MVRRTFIASVGLGLFLCGCSVDPVEILGFQLVTATPGVIQGGNIAVAWTLTGTGFEPGATVSTDAVDVTISNVMVVDANQITFDLTALNTIVTGTAQISVMNSGAQSRSTTVATIPETVTLSGEVQPIFTAHCTGCHSGGAPAAGLNLSTGAAHGATVGVASTGVPALNLIEAGDPGTSYLLDKVLGVAAVGAQMPLNGTPLTVTEIALIAEWATAGALDN